MVVGHCRSSKITLRTLGKRLHLYNCACDSGVPRPRPNQSKTVKGRAFQNLFNRVKRLNDKNNYGRPTVPKLF